MAAGNSQVQDNDANATAAPEAGGRSLLGAAAGAIGSVISAVWNAVTADGTLAAAGRQGIDELGEALKAFPESIQVQESGTIFNPTQGEIASARSDAKAGFSLHPSHGQSAGSRDTWPSEMAKANASIEAAQDLGHDHGDGHSM